MCFEPSCLEKSGTPVRTCVLDLVVRETNKKTCFGPGCLGNSLKKHMCFGPGCLENHEKLMCFGPGGLEHLLKHMCFGPGCLENM